MRMERAACTALHELVRLNAVDVPKLRDLINSVLLHAFTKASTPDTHGSLRMLPQDCTRWYMSRLLQVCACPCVSLVDMHLLCDNTGFSGF